MKLSPEAWQVMLLYMSTFSSILLFKTDLYADIFRLNVYTPHCTIHSHTKHIHRLCQEALGLTRHTEQYVHSWVSNIRASSGWTYRGQMALSHYITAAAQSTEKLLGEQDWGFTAATSNLINSLNSIQLVALLPMSSLQVRMSLLPSCRVNLT